MPGAVFAIRKQVGDSVEEGEAVIILEAMKMEMPVNAPCAGTIREILAAKGDQVGAGQTLAHIS
jgi:biotin carboxyl carrier protein